MVRWGMKLKCLFDIQFAIQHKCCLPADNERHLKGLPSGCRRKKASESERDKDTRAVVERNRKVISAVCDQTRIRWVREGAGHNEWEGGRNFHLAQRVARFFCVDLL
jgi:hypothetical protein